MGGISSSFWSLKEGGVSILADIWKNIFWLFIVNVEIADVENTSDRDWEGKNTSDPDWVMTTGIVFLLASKYKHVSRNTSDPDWVSITGIFGTSLIMTQVNILRLVSDMISILSDQKFHHLGVGLRAETLHEDLNEIMG